MGGSQSCDPPFFIKMNEIGQYLALVLFGSSAFLKGLALLGPSKLFNQSHPMLHIKYRDLLIAAVIAEILVILSRPILGKKVFSVLTTLLSGNFLLYHGLAKILGFRESCLCLGNLFDYFPYLANHEARIIQALAFILFISGVQMMHACWSESDSFVKTQN
jgi:hypothetical protein